MSIRFWTVSADFETRSELNLKKVGAWTYSMHPSTDALCLGYAIDSRPRRMWHRGEPPPADLCRAVKAGALFEAHNSFFEWCIWMNVMVKRYGWPALQLDQMVCSAARASVACLPRALENALIAIDAPVRKLDKKALNKLSKPRKPTKNDPRVWLEEEDEPELYKQLYEYCDGDVVGEMHLSKRLPALSRFERKVFKADFNINLRGIRVDVDFIRAAIRVAGMIDRELGSELTELTRGRVMAATERDRILAFLESTGLDLGALDAETVEDTLYHERLTKTQRRVLQIRQEGARSSVSKYKAFVAFLGEDEVVRGLYMYYGANAHGRWSGKGPQPQNLPRGDAKCADTNIKGNDAIEFMVAAIKKVAKTGDLGYLRKHFRIEEMTVPGDPKSPRRLVPSSPAEVLSTAIRGAFVAREGKVYGVGDYAAIEARFVFWLADEKYGLNILANDGDIYRDQASVIFNKKPEDLDVSFERMMGKTVVLGCGYGMGWKKFKLTCKKNYGIIISDELAKKCVKAYRTRYRNVPKMWDELDAKAKKAIRTGMPTYACKRKVMFSMRDGDLVIRLPSGREIFHRRARIRNDQIVFVGGKGYTESTYGGKLCEYIASGGSRDMLADAIVQCEEQEEYDVAVVMHSHDEIVGEGKKGVSKIIERAMKNQPSWSKGLPIKVEVWEGPRYHK